MLASIPSPSTNSFQLGPLEVHFYGVVIAIGVALAFMIVRRRFEARGGDPDLVERVMIWTVVMGFLGARLAYVSTHLYRFEGRPWAIFAIWEGGLAFFGGLTLGGITALYLMRRWGGDVWDFADGVAIGIPAAQAIGRWGNYFNQELFGTPSDLPWAVEIAPQYRPEQYAEFATFHPTFLYESVWNIGVVGVLLLIERRRDLQRGSLFGLYLVAYGIGRFLLELMRTDTTFRLLGLSRNGWVSLLVVLAAVIWVTLRERRGGPLVWAAPRDVTPSDDPGPTTQTPADQHSE